MKRKTNRRHSAVCQAFRKKHYASWGLSPDSKKPLYYPLSKCFFFGRGSLAAGSPSWMTKWRRRKKKRPAFSPFSPKSFFSVQKKQSNSISTFARSWETARLVREDLVFFFSQCRFSCSSHDVILAWSIRHISESLIRFDKASSSGSRKRTRLTES